MRNSDQNDADIKKFLDCVVVGEVIVLEAQGSWHRPTVAMRLCHETGKSLRLNRPVTFP